MSANDPIAHLYDRLRRMAVSEPKQARQTICALANGRTETLDLVLDLASRPGESRVRQVVAAAARLDLPAHGLEPWLRRWLDVEPDEFTRSAIEAALTSRTRASQPAKPARELPAQLLEAYRYVSERLCHRVRNTMTAPAAQLVRLESLLRRVEDAAVRSDLTAILGDLRSGFHRLGRGVQFDVGDDYLHWQTFSLADWLDGARLEFASLFGPAALELAGEAAAQRCRVRATKFLLDTVFGNLWANALQAAGHPCTITARFTARDRTVEVVMQDNGPGFAEQHLETAFQQSFSTNAESRGRGLLEIAEAVAQMQGKAYLAEVRRGEFRIHICLPTDTA
jgi:signal transduction histidine kinase